MIVVEARNAHVMKFLPPRCELSIFLGEKCGAENVMYFFLN
jgi:hypothetical protein